MRIIKNQIVAKNGSGFVHLQAEQPEDMWHLYNLIAKDDSVRSTTVRNVSKIVIPDRQRLRYRPALHS